MARIEISGSTFCLLVVLAACGTGTDALPQRDPGADASTPPIASGDAGVTGGSPPASDAGPADDAASMAANDGGSGEGGSADGGSDDAGSNDAGSNDAGSNDAGSNDAGSNDAGSNDAGSADGGAPTTSYTNPVLGVSGDPFCARFGDAYYLYLPHQTGNGRVVAFRSTDLVSWKPLGSVYDNPDPSSTGIWAPEVLAHGGKYYLYYARLMPGGNDPGTVGNKDIVVVESSDPTGFDGGKRTVLLDDAYAFIDPSPFVDPKTGELFLVFKHRGAQGSGSEIEIQSMTNPTTLAGTAKPLVQSSDVPNSDHIVEQPMLWRDQGTFFLLFSRGDGDGLDYAIAYATASDAKGPYTYRGLFFHSDSPLGGNLAGKVISPGSSSIVRDGADRTWMVYRQKKTTQITFADRAVCIDRVTFAPPTIEGSPTKGAPEPGPTPL